MALHRVASRSAWRELHSGKRWNEHHDKKLGGIREGLTRMEWSVRWMKSGFVRWRGRGGRLRRTLRCPHATSPAREHGCGRELNELHRGYGCGCVRHDVPHCTARQGYAHECERKYSNPHPPHSSLAPDVSWRASQDDADDNARATACGRQARRCHTRSVSGGRNNRNRSRRRERRCRSPPAVWLCCSRREGAAAAAAHFSTGAKAAGNAPPPRSTLVSGRPCRKGLPRECLVFGPRDGGWGE